MTLSTQALPEQLDALEQRLARLLGIMESLAADNQTLRDSEKKLQEECVALQKKNEMACVQIETIVERLKQAGAQ